MKPSGPPVIENVKVTLSTSSYFTRTHFMMASLCPIIFVNFLGLSIRIKTNCQLRVFFLIIKVLNL